uniref:Uncharacterized protein n=1 Tax=Euplotes vanleeuwenhoeki TaxID=2794224 RepID=A0A7T1C4Z7_9SPIT|nr:hypothetical protein KQ443_mgp12 [Euplotes vanleeuwenhoeki]QPM99266.1 hypothetical protein MitoLV_39 [Euplotes vanleeuwenhoeki]
MNYLINQPNNYLANTLGLGSHWLSSLVTSPIAHKYSAYIYIYLNYYIRLIFKSGLMWSNHPFVNSLFFFNNETHIHSIPNYITNLTVVKFFRIRRLKLGNDVRLKTQFIYRNYKKYLNMSKLFIYFYNSWILLSLHVYIPIIYKRKINFIKRTNTIYKVEKYSNLAFKSFLFKNLFTLQNLLLQFQLFSIF